MVYHLDLNDMKVELTLVYECETTDPKALANWAHEKLMVGDTTSVIEQFQIGWQAPKSTLVKILSEDET